MLRPQSEAIIQLFLRECRRYSCAEGALITIRWLSACHLLAIGLPLRTSNDAPHQVQGTPGEDIAIIMCGYEDDVNALLRDANPGLARRFRPEDAFLFADYTDPQLVHT